jgi:NADH-quinone oxidoreductase subunit J
VLEWLAFLFLAVAALASAAVVALPAFRNTVHCALALAFNLVSIAGLFFLLHAQFIAFLQVVVYAGAIMVLILFVLMLLNIRDEERLAPSGLIQRGLGPLLVLAFAAIVLGVLRAALGRTGFSEVSPNFGTVRELGLELFTRFFYPFEAISLLLVVAMIGAVLLAKRRL